MSVQCQAGNSPKILLPEVFRFAIGGHCRDYLLVELRNGKLACCYTDSGYFFGEPAWLEPSPEQWQDFLRAAAEAGVWTWDANYLNIRVLDGTQWSLQLQSDGRSVRCEGDNAYPGSTSTDHGPDTAFGHFLKAIRDLTGMQLIG